MKIQATNHEPIESQGISGQGNFSIKTSGHAFRLLSSGLYTNKIQAVIRELSCNAADAHVMNANQKKAFDIKLPNGLDGQFYVRDYGPGMSDDDVMKLYTTYFESTKQQSNDFTGGFGVGSKSPFAYTDMFTVVSINNGTKSTYSAYVDDNGEPKIARLGDSEPTDEPSGLSVGFPVKPEDQRAFQREASEVLMWFKSPVNILGIGDSSKPEPFDGKGVLFRAPNVLLYGKKSNGNISVDYPPGQTTRGQLGSLVMGNVRYPLPMDDSLRDLPEAQWFSTNNAVFTVPIGTVSVAASREALAFDKFTKEAVRNLLKTAFVDVSQELWSHIEKKTIATAGRADLESHRTARQALKALKLYDSNITTVFMDAIKATPEQRQLFEPRFLVDPTNVPRTFTLFKLESRGYGHNQVLNVGTPIEWSRTSMSQLSKQEIDMNIGYSFIENGARMHSSRVDTALTNVLNANKKGTGYNDYRSHVYMLVPVDKASPAEYAKEKEKWENYLGVTMPTFSKIGEVFKNEGISALNPYDYNTQSVELLASTPPFFWMTESQFKLTGGSLTHDRANYNLTVSPRSITELQKNLGMKTVVEKMYVVSDADADKVKSLCTNAYNFVDDFCIKTLLAPKMQTKISKIKPMMSQSSSTFSSIRGRVKREPEWAKTLEDSQLGSWLERMQGVKGSMSFDFTTMKVLTHLKSALGEDKFPTVIPEYYDGREVEKTIAAGYPFLATHVALRATLGVQELQHLKSYLNWCEQNGAKPPGQSKVDETEVTPGP